MIDTARRDPLFGWVVVAALSITETTSWGVIYYGFPIFLAPIEATFGWSRLQMSLAFSLALAGQGIAGVFVGRRLDNHSPRALMTAGSIAASALVFAWSRVETLAGFYLLWMAMGVVMSTILYEPAFTVVTKWFVVRRREALTAVTLVAGFASTIFLPLHNRLIDELGWRDALVVLAVLLAVITIPLHALVLRPSPLRAAVSRGAHGPVEATRREATRSRSFRYLVAAYVLNALVGAALALHQITYLGERGYSRTFAASATGLLGAMQVPGRLLFAPLSRRLARPTVTTLVFVMTAGGVALLALGRGWLIWAFVVVYGMARGMSTLLRATLVADLFGASHYGAISGALSLWTTAALAVGPLAAGALYDIFGGYHEVIWVLLALAVAAAGAASLVEGSPRRAAPGAAG